MKKLLGILVLGLLWCNVGFADDIKIKRIECDRYESEIRHENIFIIVSPNSKKATIYSVYDRRLWKEIPQFIINEYNVRSDLLNIYFSQNDSLGPRYVLNREKTSLSTSRRDFPLWGCSQMDDEFNPEKYVIEIVNKMLEEQENKNKF